MADIVLNIKTQIAELQKDIKKVQQGQKELAKQSDKTQKTMQKNIKGTTKSVEGLGSALLAVFSVAAVTQLTKSIINIRKEFETFRAVLANTLGSTEAANREFAKIQKFASETPFSVRELTDSFVRLVNQGFKPTQKEMRAMGDLAASTGKSFTQLAEAIIDAQTGEFERLKEFGIRAKKEGDKVTFTFKEQETQVDFTASAIQNYVLSLGDAEGVSGAMAAISETLNGQISNLGDSWEGLLDVLGGKTEGVFKGVIGWLSRGIEGMKAFAEASETATAGMREGLNLIEALTGEDGEKDLFAINFQLEKYNRLLLQLQSDIATIQEQGGKGILGTGERINKRELQDMIDRREEIIAVIGVLKDATIVEEDSTIAVKENTKAIEARHKAWLQSLALTKKLEEEEDKYFDALVDVNFLQDESALVTEDINERLKQSATDKTDHIIAEYEREIAAAEAAELRKQLLTEGTTEAILSGLDVIAAANKDNAKIQQAVSIAQAIINGALGITKTGANLGYPAAIPFQIALGLQTLAQIATIRSQKFEKGGYDILKGRRHAQGGVDIGIGEAEDGEGVAVFSRAATQKYGKFLPAFVKAINENDGELGYSDGAYMINFDDSKSVNELKGIKQILNKPEIRYEKGYRIEIRKGQTTRVKI